MNPFVILARWFWVVFILLTIVHAVLLRFRAQRHIRENPDLADGYTTLIRGFVFWCNIPWVVMGIGTLFGGVPTMFDFMRPRDGNPFVLAFFGSIFLLYIMGTFWLLFRGGAEMLIKHPGFIGGDFKNPLMLKLVWLLCLTGGIIGIITFFTMDVPALPVGANAIR
jgi:hypothetical protein